jgi:electron transport complex protein RnfB
MPVIPIQVERIDAVLPQTQCGQCGHPGCLPYATALANDEADINRCPPGGDEGIHKLADLLGKPYKPFEQDAPQPKPRAVAVIDESTCIGCTLCLQACPVDAILGAAKQMHTIIASDCTGCELCIAPCPVDCISMEPLPEATRELLLADHWRERHRFRVFRLERDKSEKAQRLAEKSAAKATPISAESQRQVAELGIKTAANELDKKAAIAAAMQRAAEQRASQTAATVNNDEAKQAAIQAAIERAAARKAAALVRAAHVNESVLSQPKAGLSDADKKDLIQAAMERAAAMRNAQNEESSKDR